MIIKFFLILLTLNNINNPNTNIKKNNAMAQIRTIGGNPMDLKI